MSARFALAAALTLASRTAATSSQAAVIDFETVPGATPADKLAISDQFEPTLGVTFSVSSGGLFLEAVGSSDTGPGFQNNTLNAYDVASPGFESQLQKYFLRIGTTNLLDKPVPTMLITYTTPVAAASAQIWDIDGDGTATEQWRVDARNSAGVLLQSILSPLGSTYDASGLDGKPWTWSFDHGTQADISSISLTFVGGKQTGIGLAFDNFSPSSPTTIPEPESLALAIAGGATLLASGAVRRRRSGRKAA